MGLFSRKSDHPMADPKSAQALLDELPKNDALKTLQELTGWIESVREDQHFHLDQRYAALSQLDETARQFERKLTRELYNSATLSQFQENRLWSALNDFYTQLSSAYGEVLTGCGLGDKGASALKPSQPLIAVRSIHALVGRLKCAAARYLLPESDVWALLAACYVRADAEQYLDAKVALYPGWPATATVHCEFSSMLLWWISGIGTLRPQQMHLAERLASHLCSYYTVETRPLTGTLVCFDVAQPEQPVRFTGAMRVRSGMRFVGIGQARAQLESLRKTLDKGIVPDDLNLGGSYDVDSIASVVSHFLAQWGHPPPMRRAPRRNIRIKLQVAGGFSGVIEQTDVGLNFSEGEVDSWEIEEISANGFRCVLPPSRADGISIGLLLGVKPDNVSDWGAGIVRRLSRDGDNNLHVGVELLANRVHGAALRESSAGLDDEPALWLLRNDADDGEAWLLTKPDTFSLSRSLNMFVQNRKYLLMPLALVERGDDYDFARYRKIEQDTSSEVEAY